MSTFLVGPDGRYVAAQHGPGVSFKIKGMEAVAVTNATFEAAQALAKENPEIARFDPETQTLSTVEPAPDETPTE